MQPPVRVAVDLGALFVLPPHHPSAVVADGLRLRGVVPGRLSAWARSEQGDWFGLVVYDATAADGSGGSPVSHWVPAHLVRPLDGARDGTRNTAGGAGTRNTAGEAGSRNTAGGAGVGAD